jgi:hypothetical protein
MSTAKPPTTEQLNAQLAYLKLLFIREHYASLAIEAAQAHWGAMWSFSPASSPARRCCARSALPSGAFARRASPSSRP